MDLQLLIEISGLIIGIVSLFFGGTYLYKKYSKQKTKVKGNDNQTATQQGEKNSVTQIGTQINRLPSQTLKCARCETSGKELRKGLCAICDAEVQLGGYVQEYASLSKRAPHLNFAEAERHQYLSGLINNLRGQLKSFEHMKNPKTADVAKQRIGILNKGKNNTFINNKFAGLDVGIQDEGDGTKARGNRFI